MSDLPSHASRNLCKKERDKMRAALHSKAGGVTLEQVLWLLDEADFLEREAVSSESEARHWHNRFGEGHRR